MESSESKYKVQVFVAHGYFEYEVSRMEQALAHAQAIMTTQVYRRSIPNQDVVEFHTAYKVKIKGPGLQSQYVDKFVRT